MRERPHAGRPGGRSGRLILHSEHTATAATSSENQEVRPTLNGQTGKGLVAGGTVPPQTTTDLFPERDCQMSAETKVVPSAAKRIRDGNPEPRVPCVLLLDVSDSMSGDKIHELNAGLATLRTELVKD